MTMSEEEAKDYLNGLYDGLLEKPMLLLSVKLDNRAQAELLIKWMYDLEKPIAAELHGIHWDSVAVRREDYNKYEAIRNMLQD